MPVNPRGIWIPEKMEGQQQDFETYYFWNDSTVVIISSVQQKIRDSIIFRTEPGFNIKKGVIKPISDRQFAISCKVIYRFIKFTGENHNKVFVDTVSIDDENNKKRIKINGIPYEPGWLYTKESKDGIISIVTKMVPDIEKHPERFD